MSDYFKSELDSFKQNSKKLRRDLLRYFRGAEFDTGGNGGGGSVSTLYDPANWPDLRNYYALEGTSKDYVGNLDLSEFGTVNYVNGVKNTQGISTENSDSGFGKIDVSIPTDGLTWSTFVRAKDSTPTAPSVTETDQSGNFVAPVLTLTESGGVLAGQVRTDQGVIGLGSSISPSGGNTYHMALTFDGSDVRLLINGSIEAEKTNVGSAIDDSGIISIFVSDSNQSEWIDETMLFNRALSQSEINTIYQKGTSTGSTSTLYDSNNWSSMTHYWPLDGDGTDAVGSSDLSESGSPNYTTAVSNKGFAPDGSDDQLRTPISLPNSTMTISAWVEYSSTHEAGINFINTSVPEVTTALVATGDPEEHAFKIETTEGIKGNRGSQLSAGTKYHLVLRYDGSNAEYFVNNSVDSSVTISGDIVDDNLELFLGGISLVGEYYDINYIDEVAIFNKALTNSEIDTLYQKGI